MSFNFHWIYQFIDSPPLKTPPESGVLMWILGSLWDRRETASVHSCLYVLLWEALLLLWVVLCTFLPGASPACGWARRTVELGAQRWLCGLSRLFYLKEVGKSEFSHNLLALQICIFTYNSLKWRFKQGMMIHVFNPSMWEANAGGTLRLEASLVNTASSRPAKDRQLEPISNSKNK